MFAIYAGDALVGHSALECGDSPMGVAYGLFIAADGYDAVRHECRTNHADQSGLALSARTPAGNPLPCIAVAVLDYSDQAAEGQPAYVEAAVLGIPHPLYAELFPEHVAAYAQRFPAR